MKDNKLTVLTNAAWAPEDITSESAAAELAKEVVGKLIQTSFTAENQPDYQTINNATTFLSEFIRQKEQEKNQPGKTLKFDDSQMQNLAGKLISFYLNQGVRYGYSNLYSILPIAEKLSPSSVESLKKLHKNSPRHGFHSDYDPEVSKVLNGEMTAEQMLGEAKKFPVSSRRQIYHSAASKLAQQGNFSRATEILTDNFEDDALEDALRNLNWQYSHSLISEGKFAEAERIVDGFPENTRLGALISLANAIYQKNKEENKSYAVAVLGKARALIPEKPEDSNEMSNLMQIISAFSIIEPAEAFRLFEPLVPQLNELSEAAVVINGFQRNSNVKQGEFLLSNGNSWGFYVDFSVLSKLSTDDFERTLNLIDALTRREIRVSLKLQLAESVIN